MLKVYACAYRLNASEHYFDTNSYLLSLAPEMLDIHLTLSYKRSITDMCRISEVFIISVFLSQCTATLMYRCLSLTV